MPTLNLQVSATGDDGAESGGSWTSTGIENWMGYFSGEEAAGVRFPTVNLAQGVTISSATLTFTANNSDGTLSNWHMRIYGDAVNNAAAWSSTSRPTQITQTTAFANWNLSAWVTNTEYSVTVTSIVQELVNRAGWVANNAMRFAIRDNSTVGNVDVSFYDVSGSGPKAAKLDITYTTGTNQALAGTVASTTAATAAVAVAHTVVGVSAAASAVTTDLAVAHSLAASVASSSSVAADLGVSGAPALAGASASTSAVTASVDVVHTLASASASASTVAGSITAAYALSGTAASTSAVAGGLDAGTTVYNPSFATLNTTVTNNLSFDGFSWTQSFPLQRDKYGHWFALAQDNSGYTGIAYSNDNGATWADDTGLTAGQKTGLARGGSIAYDSTNDIVHVLWQDSSDGGGVLYRRYTVNRDGSNNITSFTQDTNVNLYLDTQLGGQTVLYRHPVLLWCDDAAFGTYGAIVAVWAVEVRTSVPYQSEIRASYRVLANSSADNTAANWAGPNTNDTTTQGNQPAVPYSSVFVYSDNINRSDPHPAYCSAFRKTAGTNAKDIYVFWARDDTKAYGFRRLRWNSGASKWSTGLSTATAISNFTRAGTDTGYSQKGELLTKPAEDTVNDRVYFGFPSWKNDTAGESWSFVYIDSIDTVSSVADPYSVGGNHSYLPTGDITFDNTSQRLIAAYRKSSGDGNGTYVRAYAGTASTEDEVLMTSLLVDIPLLWQGARFGTADPYKLPALWRRDESVPRHGYFGTFDYRAAVGQTQALAGTSAGVSAAAADVAVAHPLAAACASVSASSADVAVAHPLAGTAAGVSAATADAVVASTLGGATAGVSSAAADVMVAYVLAGMAAAASAVAGDLSLAGAQALAGVSAAASTTSADVVVAHTLAGTSASTSSVAADTAIALTLAAVSASTSGVSADADVAHTLAATSASTSAVAADAAIAHTLAGASMGASAAVADVGVAHTLAAVSASTSSVAAGLDVTGASALVGTATSASAVSASLTAAYTLAASSASVSALTADAAVAHPLAGAVAGAASVDGLLAAAHALSASCAGVSAVASSSLDTTTAQAMTAAVASTSSVTGALLADRGLSGASASASVVSGDLALALTLAGLAAGQSVSAGALALAYTLAGSVVGSSALSANLDLGAVRPVASVARVGGPVATVVKT